MAIKWKFWQRSRPKETRRLIQANDPVFNAQFEYANNHVSTSKYNLLTFLPLNLFEQFRRLANAYFLGLLILQLIPQVSSLTPITTILPLGFVILLKAIKDAIDDWTRHSNDNLVNSRPTYVLRDGQFIKEKWCKIAVGEIIKLENDDFVAADLLLLASSEPHGLCYIETAELDGETNLKVKQAIAETYSKFKSAINDRNPEKINSIASSLDFTVECEAPNEVLNEFEGTLTWRSGETVSLDNDKLLLRGCRLRNTKWCYGLVVFAGSDTKLMKNGGKTTFKQTHIDAFLNKLILGIVVFLLVMCALCTIGAGFWESFYGFKFQDYLLWEDFVSDDRHLGSLVIAALVFLSYVIILNTVVPISLYVSIEFIRLMQSFWINWDEKMYYEKNEIAAKARSTTLNEELGQIEYIFSDKTGTLTQNIMTFNKCSINGRLYGYLYDSANNEIPIDDQTTPLDLSWNRYAEPTFKFYDRKLITDIRSGDESCHRFFTLLSVCHTVMTADKEGVLEYQAQSPDEAALVSAARNFGFVFKSRSPKAITVEIQGKDYTYKVLNILDFNNVRKRMSVICQIGDKIILYCKGADSIIKERLDPESLRLFDSSEGHLDKFANEALRTLCLAWREIPEAEYQTWATDYHAASTSLENRADKVSEVYERIERNLKFIGSTAIEDKLQDGVPECIAKLAKANIKIWVLTGDKQETAVNIGYSCQLLTNSMEVHILESNSEGELLAEIRRLRAIVGENSKKNEFEREYQNLTSYANPTAIFRNPSPAAIGPAQSPSPTLLIEQALGSSGLTENALVINGQSLVHALMPSCEKEFLDLACLCKAVICCRVTPGQKKAVVDLVKTHKKAITLAVGDGANDVSMIKSAHIGVGISGQEGQQAVLASDFSIGQFRYLERLLLVHGRWSYYRISKFLRYFFYKNFASTLCHFWFAFFCGFSAQALFDPFFQSTYNVFFSSLPVLALGIFDQDVSEEMSIKYPALYVAGQKGELFNRKEFVLSVVHGIASSLVLFFVPYGTMFMSVHTNGDNADDLQSFGFTIATILVIVVNLQCGLETSYWTFFNHFSIWGTLIVHFIFHFVLYSELVYKIFGFNYFFVGTAQEVTSTAIFWFTLLLVCVLLLLPVIAFFFVKSYFKPTISDSVRMHMKRTKTRIFVRSTSNRRSNYAFAHQEGFAKVITMLNDEGLTKPASRSLLASNPNRLKFHA